MEERENMSSEEYRRAVMGNPMTHATTACQALHEYEYYANKRDAAMYEQIYSEKHRTFMNGRRLNTPALPPVSMNKIAMKYGVTINEMKQHWCCVERTEREGRQYIPEPVEQITFITIKDIP